MIKTKNYTVSTAWDCRTRKENPIIRLSGQWLNNINMPIGAKLKCYVKNGKILLSIDN